MAAPSDSHQPGAGDGPLGRLAMRDRDDPVGRAVNDQGRDADAGWRLHWQHFDLSQVVTAARPAQRLGQDEHGGEDLPARGAHDRAEQPVQKPRQPVGRADH